MQAIYIAVIVAVALVVIVFMLRDRITFLSVGGSGQRGKNRIAGRVGMKAAPPRNRDADHYSIDFSGNKFQGSGGETNISRDNVRFSENEVYGNRNFNIEESNRPVELPNSDQERDLPENR